MSDIYQFPTSDDQDDEVALWVAKLDRGLSHDEEQELQQWLVVDASRRDSLLEMAELWDCADSLSRLAQMCPREKPVNRISTKYVSVAASSLFLIVSLIFMLQSSQPSVNKDNTLLGVVAPQRKAYQTAIGEQSTVVLDDGTQLLLNTDTMLSVEYSRDHRRIDLQRGELHVVVTKDEKRPLTVYANGKAVRAVGTAFNVERVDDYEIELLVTEGIVSVTSDALASTTNEGALREWAGESAIKVVAGYQLSMNRDKRVLLKVARNEVDNKLAWRAGNLIFKGESLEMVVNEINRYTSVKFEFADEAIKKIRVVGLFKAGDVLGLTTMLEKNFQLSVNYKEYEKRIVLNKRPSIE